MDPDQLRSRNLGLIVIMCGAFAVFLAFIVWKANNPTIVVVDKSGKAVTQAPRPRPIDRDFPSDWREGAPVVPLLGALCLMGVLYACVVILIMVWVVRDCRARAVDGSAVWVLIMLLFGPVGLIVYVASRPYGLLVRCGNCGNRKLAAAEKCTHCGAERGL